MAVRSTVNRWQSGLAAVAVLGLLLFAARPCRSGDPEAIHPCRGFNPAGSIKTLMVEFGSLDDWYKLYARALTRPAGGDARPTPSTRPDDPYGVAMADLTVGLLENDPSLIGKAESQFATEGSAVSDRREKEVSSLGVKYADEILSGKYPAGAAEPAKFVPVVIARNDPPKQPFTRIILGRSAITVRRHALVKTQVDRVIRDWQLGRNVKTPPWGYSFGGLVPWHEGHKMQELVDLADVRVVPVWGTKAKKIDGHWYAPDASGAFRFEISEDKVINYPTTLAIDENDAVLNDTHGISAIAWDSLDADLVVGCGDHKGKMDAAYYLADKGVNVYCPTDRFIGQLVGARTKGVIIGSGPVRQSGDGAVIGAQAISFDVTEPIVVCNAQPTYPIRYYDAPFTYFTALAGFARKPLNIVPVEVKDYGHADVVVDQARKLGAKLIGIRVKSLREHDAVSAWLKEDPARRAVLFHTAVYPDGYRLFFEFPRQTAFGDIAPQFE